MCNTRLADTEVVCKSVTNVERRTSPHHRQKEPVRTTKSSIRCPPSVAQTEASRLSLVRDSLGKY